MNTEPFDSVLGICVRMSGAKRSAAVCDVSPSTRLMSHYFSSALALALRLA